MLTNTGEAPSDPNIGFLPPNNGTTGQGFVTFTIYPDDDASNLAVIDAEASIVFDANEPINTPPIFNTVSIVDAYKGDALVDPVLFLVRCYLLFL